MPRARGARQQPRRVAIQERTQECMTAVMNEGIAPCGGPGGASFAKGSRRKAATPEGCDSRADSRMRDWGPDRSQRTSVEVPEEPQLPRARGARQQPRKDAIPERTQDCMSWVLTAVSACWEGPAGAVQCLNTGVMAVVMAA